MLTNAKIPVLGFVAPSGTGKTTLLRRLIPILKATGLRIAIIKHSHHKFDIDQPSKDSYLLRQAGAEQTLIASRHRWALIVENPQPGEKTDLDKLIRHLDQDMLDIILVEGFKHTAFPKIELHRSATEKPLLFPDDDDIIAIASDQPLHTADHLEQLDLNDPAAVCAFITTTFGLTPSTQTLKGNDT
jgi:molybdopterin-guanine dinucleotide biosynthesis protein B